MSSILIAGGAGFIGSHTAKVVAEAGLQPVVFDNLSSGHEWALRWGVFERGDLADKASIVAAIRRHDVKAVMQFAGFIEVGESVRDPSKYLRGNLFNTLNLLDAMVETGVRDIVFSSTAAVYGVPVHVPIREDHPLLPINPYGESKLGVERALAAYETAHGLRWAALRYFNAAGGDPQGLIGEAHGPESHLIPLAMAAALGERGPLQIFGNDYPTPDGTAVRDYIHVLDLADAHLLAVSHLQRGLGSFAANLGTGRGRSVSEVVASIERVSHRAVPREIAPRRPGDPPVLVADPSRAIELLGWQPRNPDLDTMVSHAWAWHARRSARAA
jgi:UDP-arabinose 4-epimerase